MTPKNFLSNLSIHYNKVSLFQKRFYKSSGKKVSEKFGFDPYQDVRNTRRRQPQKISQPKYVNTEELFDPSDESQNLFNYTNKDILQRQKQQMENRRSDVIEEEFELLRHKVALKEINTVTRDVILSDQENGISAENLDRDSMVDAYNEPIQRGEDEPFIKDRYFHIIEELKKDLFDIQQVMNLVSGFLKR